MIEWYTSAMNLQENWPQIRSTFESSIRSSLHCSIASIREDGYPHVTPIGHIFLRDDQTAFYFEEHTRRLPQNLQHNRRVCLSFVNSKGWFWARALFSGHFTSPPGMRLLGIAGERRVASDAEKSAYEARVRAFKRLKGYALIWKDLSHVRDVTIEWCEPILYPHMTTGLWK